MKVHGFAVNPDNQKVVERRGSFKGKHSGLLHFLCFFGLGFLALFFLLLPLLLGFRVCLCWGLLLFEKNPRFFLFLRKLMAALPLGED
jgi:hypothetical protein